MSEGGGKSVIPDSCRFHGEKVLEHCILIVLTLLVLMHLPRRLSHNPKVGPYGQRQLMAMLCVTSRHTTQYETEVKVISTDAQVPSKRKSKKKNH